MTEPDPAALDTASPGPSLCDPALALRAVVGVQAALALGALATAPAWAAVIDRVGPALAAGLTGTLLWLVVACALRRPLADAAPLLRDAVLLALAAGVAWLAWVPIVALGLSAWTPPRALAVPLCGAALALPLVLWLRRREQAVQPADTAARLALLQSRIRPHFLFNALNTAIALVRVDPARAEAVLEDLAQLFRVALSQPRPAMRLDDEIELAQRYLAIEQVRFGERLHIAWDIDPAAGRAAVPPLLLQPLVENAVRHGVEPSPEGGRIRVRTRARRGQAEIVIDNTVGRTAGTPGNGMALANVRERLRLLHDVAAQFESHAVDGGWQVRVVVPL
jgi:two-component system sensor histidine kinase AlgZ